MNVWSRELYTSETASGGQNTIVFDTDAEAIAFAAYAPYLRPRSPAPTSVSLPPALQAERGNPPQPRDVRRGWVRLPDERFAEIPSIMSFLAVPAKTESNC
ncbi:hypothetical protein ACFVGY_18520 [Streptomyces sp. NPDC127106]|uniref:hypothetical protein n=1 Tax=Streptomyces sp. NPDC127106 TaxID=3345360 RepID=UPI0036323802